MTPSQLEEYKQHLIEQTKLAGNWTERCAYIEALDKLNSILEAK